MSLDQQIEEINRHFPGTKAIDRDTIDVPLFPKAPVQLNLKKYPKKPEIIIVQKQIAKVVGEFDTYLPEYHDWDPNHPPSLANLLHYVKATIETIAGVKANISDNLFHDICNYAQNALPHEMFCLLRCINGVLYEFVLAPGMEASETAAVFFPHRLARDASLVASCHSHPSNNFHPSDADLQTFRSKPINIIIAYPFNVRSVGVYNMRGEPIPFEIYNTAF